MADYNNYDPNNNQGQQQNNEYSQYGYNAPIVPQERKGQSIASLILGICGFICWLIPLFGFPVTIVGIIMGALGMKKGGKGMAIAGIICSAIGLVLTLINSILGVMLSLSTLGY